jgi:plasmid stabilization system protein ParE
MSGYALHPRAYDDLDEIREYIAYESPAAADRLVDEIFDSIQAVAAFPNAGHLRPDLTSRPLRFHIVREYLIAYAPRQPLWIIAVLHGRRNPRLIASILQGRK